MAASLSRYQGTLVGGVVGDCIGAVFECLWGQVIGTQKVLTLIQSIEDDYSKTSKQKSRRKLYLFTDDTAMARSVTKSLIQNQGLNERDMAKRFTEEYFRESGRGYGGNITTVFKLLADTKYEDIYAPAKAQFDGNGSYGNGGAMRITPAGLFGHKKNLEFKELKSLSDKITTITHTHIQAIQGAFLQCYAVQLALRTEKLDCDTFVDELVDKMQILEKDSMSSDSSSTAREADSETAESKPPDTPYCHKLNKIKELVNREKQPSDTEVQEAFGFEISALEAVPAAIYCFLRSTKEIDGLQDYNQFERTIIYTISLGGDTDTIATMAGSIAGAYYGLDLIPSSWQHCSEGANDALKDAELMFNMK